MGLTIEMIKAKNQEAAKKETGKQETSKSGNPFGNESGNPGLLDGMFPLQTDDLLKGLVFSIILTEPKCRARYGQRSGSPWRSRF